MNLIDIPNRLKGGNAQAIPPPKRAPLWSKLAEDYAIHAEGKLPAKKEQNPLSKRHPNEGEDTHEWRISTFSQGSRSTWQKGIDMLHKIFGDSGSTVEPPESIREMLAQADYYNQPFALFIQQTVVPMMLKDPNALLMWVPTGEGIMDVNVPLSVAPLLVPSSRIKYLSSGSVLVLLPEKNLYRDGTNKQEGDVYFWMDTIQCAFIQQVAINTYEILPVYNYEAHELSRLPWMQLGGTMDAETGVYKSFFDAFCPAANQALMQISDQEAVTKLYAYPARVENPIECGECRGTGQAIDGTSCKPCGGKGVLNHATNPLKVYIREKLRPNQGQGFNTADDVSFYSPDPAILAHQLDLRKYMVEQMESAMHLMLTQEAQSGVAKALDREPQYSLLARIAATIYNGLIRGSIEIIYAFVEADPAKRNESWTVTPPSAFVITTLADIVEQIKSLKRDNAPDGMIREYVRKWADQYYGGNELQKRITKLLVDYDPFYANTQQLLDWRNAGLATDMDLGRHKWGEREIHKLPADFVLGKKDQEIFDALDKAIAPIVAAEAPTPLPAL